MRFTMKKIAVMMSLFAAGLTACNKWDDHNEITDPALGKTLIEEISSRADLSVYASLLKQSGLDKELSSSKVFTIWAPTNDALASLDPSVTADSAKLRAFLTNSIANGSFTIKADSVRVPMLNGKRIWVVANKFDEANVTTTNVKTGNGVLQVVDKAILPLQNAWDFVNATTTFYKQNAYVASWNQRVRDLTNAVVDSISATTGEPIYKPGTDYVTRNWYRTNVADLQDESKDFTYFVMKDNALDLEIDSLKPYFKNDTAAYMQQYYSTRAVIQDLAVEGLYTQDKLPAQIRTKYGVLPIDKSAIVETHRVSNGIVYVFDKIDFRKEDKIQPIVLQGENFSGYSSKRSVTFFRVRNDSLGNKFEDIAINGHDVTNFAIYNYTIFNSVKYKVTWVAFNDWYTVSQKLADGTSITVPSPFSQRIGIGSLTSDATTATLMPLVSVPRNTYAEREVGTVTINNYNGTSSKVYLVADAKTPLTLDYVKFTPVFE